MKDELTSYELISNTKGNNVLCPSSHPGQGEAGQEGACRPSAVIVAHKQAASGQTRHDEGLLLLVLLLLLVVIEVGVEGLIGPVLFVPLPEQYFRCLEKKLN